MKIEVYHDQEQPVFDTLVAGVRQHIDEHMGPERTRPLAVVARDDEGAILGGVSGRTIYRNWLIEVLWVDKASRSRGLGRQLMQLAEEEARSRGCLVAQVDTLSFQAPLFYQKLGFDIVGSVPGFEGSPQRYFLLKQYR